MTVMKKRIAALFIAAVMFFGMIPWSPFGFAAAAETETEEDYTDPDHPYIATNFSGLQAVFEKERPKGTTIYIKLGCNIEDAVKERWGYFNCSRCWQLCRYWLRCRCSSAFRCS